MAILMFALAFVYGYLVFITFAYLVAKLIFTRIDKEEQRAKEEKLMLRSKAKRVRTRRGVLAHV
jgi:hydrogenase-4 membrane subunit HyfE